MGAATEVKRSGAGPIDDRHYRLSVESVADYAIYLLDPNGDITSWNAGARRLKGYAEAEIIGRNVALFYTPEDRASGEPRRSLDIALTDGRFENEGWRVRKDGGRFWASVVIDPIFEDDQLVGFAKVTHDVSTRKAALDSLRDALAANQAILDHSLDVICTISREGLFTQVSKHAEEVWGYPAELLIGRRYIDFVHPEDRDDTLDVANRIADGNPTSSFKNRYLHSDGSIVPIAWSAAWSEQHNALICVARDLRDSLAVEEKLRQAQKLEAIGRLTGGVAHDFNNLLTVIIGGAEALLDENRGNPAIVELADMIRAAGERGSEITSQLLTFARRQPLEPQALEVNDLLKK